MFNVQRPFRRVMLDKQERDTSDLWADLWVPRMLAGQFSLSPGHLSGAARTRLNLKRVTFCWCLTDIHKLKFQAWLLQYSDLSIANSVVKPDFF